MKGQKYRYCFKESVPLHEAEDSLMLAVLAAESMHGRSNIRLDASFQMDRSRRECSVDAATPVGRQIARIFTGFLTREFGEESFRVERLGERALTACGCQGSATDSGERLDQIRKDGR